MTHGKPTLSSMAIAVVGIGCRFPGGIEDVDSFWELLIQRRSAISSVPHDRWHHERYFHRNPAAIGRMNVQHGGFIDQPRSFDASFWGISPREAVRMDPQQRWLLEVAWEALEDSGTPPSLLKGSEVGVFVGAASHDYGTLQLNDLANVDVHTNSGGTLSIAANRISYALDLKGPSLAIDTACSSALVAISNACHSIARGECVAALAGGVNALITPNSSIGFSKASMLSPSGQCFAFDQRADGYVRSEGAGLVYLKPLDRAVADRDPIYSVIRAAAVNQDGSTSSMTVPSVEGQSKLIRRAMEQAGLSPDQFVYVETHGTGTPVGDPIEATALGTALREGRRDGDVCLIGSVKTNIGHLESASGIASLIKASLVVDRELVPANQNFQSPNPEIPLNDLGLEVVDSLRPLPTRDGKSVVGVNSFGFGGTNAHVILERPPRFESQLDNCSGGVRPRKERQTSDRPFVLPISAKNETSLQSYAKRYLRALKDFDGDLGDFCYSAAARKEQHSHRIAVVGNSQEELRTRLSSWLANETTGDAFRDALVSGVCEKPSPSPVFVFTGQGAQWLGMGRDLYHREPIAQTAFDEVDKHFTKLSGWSLVDKLLDENTDIDRTDIAQPAIFALQVALVRLWKSWGIRPSSVVGHSVGEVAAAWCAGVYTIEDAVRLVYHRSRLQNTTGGHGRMLAAAVSPEEALALIGDQNDRVQITAYNSPTLLTLGGDIEPMESIAAALEEQGRFYRWLKLDYAFHTHQMDPIRSELIESLSSLDPQSSQIPYVSTVTGQLHVDPLDGDYWWKNVRSSVQFEPAISWLIEHGETHFLEIGPHNALRSSLEDTLSAQNAEGAGSVLGSIRRGEDESISLAVNLARLHLSGSEVDWQTFCQSQGEFVRQPSYPFSRTEFWLDESVEAKRVDPVSHPLLGERIESPNPTWQSSLDPNALQYLCDHQVWEDLIFPAAGYMDIGLGIAESLFPSEAYVVEDIEFVAALFLSKDSITSLQVTFDEESHTFGIYSSTGADRWELHARGRLVKNLSPRRDLRERTLAPTKSLDHWTRQTDHDDLYESLHALGYGFGPDFSLIQRLSESNQTDDGSQALAEICVPDHIQAQLPQHRFHPAVLDTCLQATHGTRHSNQNATEDDVFFLPSRVRQFKLHQEAIPPRLFARAKRVGGSEAPICDIHVFDESGDLVAEILGFVVAPVPRSNSNDRPDDCLYQLRWEAERLPGSGSSATSAFPELSHLVDDIRPHVSKVYVDHELETYYTQFVPAMQRIVIGSVQNALLQLGWQFEIGDRVSKDQIAVTLGISDRQRSLFDANLGWLESEGFLKCEKGEYRIIKSLQPSDTNQALTKLAKAFPQCESEVALVQATSPHLADVFSGQADPLELLFPGGSGELLEAFYLHGVDFPAYQSLLKTLIAKATEKVCQRGVLRVLEVGGGTGSFTRSMLAALPEYQTEYTFTDVSPAFVADAKQRFGTVSNFHGRTLDLERCPLEQGFEPGSFDLIIAANVLHATRDLRDSVRNIRSLLAPAGILTMLEVVRRRPITDNTFGLLRGWWRFDDSPLRTDSALLSQEHWQSLLTDTGLDDIHSISFASAENAPEQAALIARRPMANESLEEGLPIDENALSSVPVTDESPWTLVFADENGLGDKLTARLKSQGHRVFCLRYGNAFARLSETEYHISVDGKADLVRFFAEIKLPSKGTGQIVHCWSLDDSSSDLNDSSLRESQSRGVLSALALSQTLAEETYPVSPRVFVVTRGAHAVDSSDEITALASSPIVGFCRVANNEQGQFRWTNIDLDSKTYALELDDLCEELTADSPETEIALRKDRRYVRRLNRLSTAELEDRRREAIESRDQRRDFRLEMNRVGALDELALAETPRQPVGPSQVSVQVNAVGINFRDVMKALGMYPGNPPDLRWFGDDFAGVIEQTGTGVSSFQVGDRVAGIAPYAMRSNLAASEDVLVRIPGHLSDTQAATFPTAFLTAMTAINEIARMRSGEKILIHAASGGVGLAAVQVAKHLGLEIFATAGTDQKRQLLLSHGVDHVMHSRNYDFAEQIMSLTGGNGVDMVLNSLAGEFIPKSLSVLAPFGRFVEIGKIDVYGNSKLGLAALKNNLSYHVLDLAEMIAHRPGRVRAVVRELQRRIDAGDYQPLPTNVFPITDAEEAFRFMAQGHHTGKNVLSLDQPSIKIGPCTQPGYLFRSDACYLVTGGAGGFGLEVVKWMAENGAKHLAVLSRSGPKDQAAEEIQQLRDDGIAITDLRGDVTLYEDVKAAIEQIHQDSLPLKGIVHGAMVLDDRFLADLDVPSFNRVLHPKMLGAWNLHQATNSIALEHFICFSSFSAIVGAPRQSNYNAGNCFLDALATYRRQRGLAALSVNWGAIAGAGFVQRSKQTANYLREIGLDTLHVQRALELLSELIRKDTDPVGVAKIDWQQLRRFSGAVAETPVYSRVIDDRQTERGQGSLKRQLTNAASSDRLRIVEQFLVREVAGVFGIDASEVNPTIALTELGLDSLLAVELVNRVESECEISLPLGSILNGPSIRTLSEVVADLLGDPLCEEQDESAAETLNSRIGFQQDCQLETTVTPAFEFRSTIEPASVLLTGATGFLGARLLHELLSQTVSKITCVVRADDSSHGMERLRNNLTQYGLSSWDLQDRVEVVVGDFSQPHLGLSQQDFERLTTEIDVIYHNGADVNLMLPYESLRDANVGGTKEILKIACQGKPKPVHFVSTFTVQLTEANRGRMVYESDDLPICEELLLGYSQTKWVGEKLVRAAMERGLPATIYRPGHITGDSRTGAANIQDLLHTIVSACLRLKAAPFRDLQLDLTPVDYVAKSIVHLSHQSLFGKTFHLTNPTPLHTDALLEWMSQSGYHIDLVGYGQWREHLLKLSETAGSKIDGARVILDALLPQVDEGDDREPHPHFDASETLEALKGSGISCPPVDYQLLNTGHRFMQKHNHVPKMNDRRGTMAT